MHARAARVGLVARPRAGATRAMIVEALRALPASVRCDPASLAASLAAEGLPVEPGIAADPAVTALARRRLVEFQAPGGCLLIPCAADFDLESWPAPAAGVWRLSRFTMLGLDEGVLTGRNPLADCILRLGSGAAAELMRFAEPADAFAAGKAAAGDIFALHLLFARARLILPCDAGGQTADESDDAARQWDAHDLFFQSQSRLGRSEKRVGAVYAFKGDIAPPPALKPVPEAWLETVVDLPRADLAALRASDVPLTAAIEERRSLRQYSLLPIAIGELGEFLFRTARVRDVTPVEDGEIAGRPYPGGGARYELEIYLSVNSCAGIGRGFYYYEPLGHRLCRVAGPGPEMDGLLEDAFWGSGGQARPQVLITLASRFNRFNWKYRGMSLAAQLKDVGVLYQTMYLVATGMELAGCALGLGDADRFRRLTGLDYLEEGSIGEFMLGRPL